jgi:hypothetical protein
MAETSSFMLVFGDTPLIKLLDFFLDNPDFDYSLSDIAKNSGISWTTLHVYWKNLLRLGVVKQTRLVGKAKMYKLNIENPLVIKLKELDLFISESFIEEELKKQSVKKLKVKK